MSFLEALHDRVLVCDGAMGSMLYDRGVFVNQSFEALNLTRPELVAEVHRAYAEAGADVIETNTFGANQVKLAGFGLADRLAEINRAGVRLARQAAGPARYVAGAIGPLGVKVGDGRSTTVETAESHFAGQAAALLEGGVDLLLLETFGYVAELEAAVRAVRRLTALPIVAQMATGEDGLSLDGVPPRGIRGDAVGPRRDHGRCELRCGPGRDARIGRADGRGDRRTALCPAERRRAEGGGGPASRPVVARVPGLLCSALCRRGRRSGWGLLRYHARAHRPDTAGRLGAVGAKAGAGLRLIPPCPSGGDSL